MWKSGIDRHKQFCVITTYGAEGARVKQARVASTPLALRLYFAQFPGPLRAACCRAQMQLLRPAGAASELE